MKQNTNKEKNKKLYKNWKLYATVLAILGIGTATGLGIYYGTTNHHEVGKTNLNTLDLNKTIIIYNLNDPKASDASIAFQAFLTLNKEKYPNLENNVEIKNNSFISLTDENSTGSLIINAKANTNYTGSLTITINYQAPTNLNNLNLTTKLPYPVYLNQQSVFDLFIKINSNINDLKDNIEIVKNSYLETDYNKIGSLEVQGKEYSKYTGNTTIIIPEKIKTNLGMFLTNTTIQGTENMDAKNAFNTVLNANSSFLNLNEHVDYSSYKAATYTTNGSITIITKKESFLTGNVTIKINAIGQTDLSDLTNINWEIQGTENMDITETFNTFITTYPQLANNVTLDETNQKQPTWTEDGSFDITATVDGKYSGTKTIKINAIGQTDLSDLTNINWEIQGTENMDITEAFNTFITTYSQLANNVTLDETNQKQPTWTEGGSFDITATADGKYSGTKTIKINAIRQLDLSTLELDTTITTEQTATAEETFNAFINKNTNILGNNLTLNQVELTNFQAPEITKNGKLTITVKSGINSKYIGSIEIEIKYFLNENNIVDVIRYLSDNNLLNFNVPTGTRQGVGGSNLLAVLIPLFRQLMSGNYEYGNNIQSIELYTYDQAPNQEQLNTQGYVWTSPSNTNIWIYVMFNDGTAPKQIKISNIHATITMV